MSKRIVCVITICIALPLFAYAQDCCGPGGGGGAAVFAAAGNEGAAYRLKSVRHYAYSARHPGFTVGAEAGGITDSGEANISPRAEYQGSWGAGALGSFDVYGGVFYSAYFEKPHSNQLDTAVNVAWRFVPDEKSRLVLRFDAEDLVIFFPDDVIYAYATREPSVNYSRAFNFGDLSLSLGFPVLLETGGGLNTYFTAGYEHPVGLSLSVCPRLTLLPDAQYSGTTFTLTFAWDAFFAKAAFVANEDFTALSISPYAEFTLGHIFFWAGADFGGLGSGDVSVSPFIGAAYHF